MTSALILNVPGEAGAAPARAGDTAALHRLEAALRNAGVADVTVVTSLQALPAASGDHLVVADATAAAPAGVLRQLLRTTSSCYVTDDAGAPMGLMHLVAGDIPAATAAASHSAAGSVSALAGELAASLPLRAVAEDDLRLDAAVKSDDSFFPTFFVSPYSRYVARWAARRGLTPNQITVLSMVIGVASAAAFATGNRAGLVAGAVLLQLSFIADCVDGQVARYTQRFSPLGAWLDATFDRLKEYLVYAGLAVGGIRAGGDDSIWVLAAAALAVQTVRHMVIFGFDERTQDRAPADADDMRTRALERADRLSVTRWAKRIVVLPIGERLALISVVAAVASPRTTFVWVLAWGALATAYVLAGRVLRAVG